jgi:hypothetical protein
MDADKLAKIRKRAEDAQFGFSGVKEQDYARDVLALLAERDELVAKSGDDLHREVKALQQLQAANERADLWKRDCEAAQLRVTELERARSEAFANEAAALLGTPSEANQS